MTSRILYLLTRTPLHVGAGASVGAIDQPIQRERHTGFPIIPATSLKGSFADQWPTGFDKNARVKITETREKEEKTKSFEFSDASWLFGSDTTEFSFAGALLFSEARVIAFPIRSAKGCHAWITSPKLLLRAAADNAISSAISDEPNEEEAIFKRDCPLDINGQIVLEDYCFSHKESADLDGLAKELARLVPDKLFQTIESRLVVLSDGMMAHFATAACEIAQHVRISDETGTAEGTGLFNQENVPSDTLFYTTVRATKSRIPDPNYQEKDAAAALDAFDAMASEDRLFQFGADASTGLGFCSIHPKD